MIQRGEIYFADLDPAREREQRGHRPVLVVSSDAINRQPLVVTIVAGTDGRNVSQDYATNVRVSSAETGLPHETVFLGFQLRSIDPVRLADPRTGAARPVGQLTAPRMGQVERALRLVLAL